MEDFIGGSPYEYFFWCSQYLSYLNLFENKYNNDNDENDYDFDNNYDVNINNNIIIMFVRSIHGAGNHCHSYSFDF